MGRSGCVDGECYDREDSWALIRYRGAVTSALRGRRGQAMLRELAEALDAMPEKRLIADELVEDGAHCALGVLGAKRGLDLENLDPEDHQAIAQQLGVSESLVREVAYENDEGALWACSRSADEEVARWHYMRAWVGDNTLPNLSGG